MYCSGCGARVDEPARFCPGCGAPVSRERAGARTPRPGNLEIDSDGRTPTFGFLGESAAGSGLIRGVRLLDRFEVVCELGRGGMGIVYQAIDHARGDDVAIKTLPAQLRHDKRAQAGIRREVNNALKLSHEHICRVYDLHDAPEAQFIAMELVLGHSLEELLARRLDEGHDGFPLDAVLRWLGPICAALDYAHGKGVIHRDLKPGNILVGRDGAVKLSDFGLSRAVQSSMSKYSREPINGTLPYMSPEQCVGKPCDARSDVYSLAMLTYELLTGQAPFAEAGDITRCHLHEDFDPIEGQADHINAALTRAAAKKPEERPASAGAFLNLLGNKARTAAAVSKGKTAESHRELEPGATRSVDLGGGVKLDLVWIPPGEFMMGSPENEEARMDDEGPQRRVQITKGFWLGKYPVTQKQWKALMKDIPSKFKGDDLPVNSVSWDDCLAFVEELRDLTGEPWRLPTEAEWEYACRAGSRTAFSFGDSYARLDKYGWYEGNSGGKTHPVGQKQPNAWGLYDMHGNVLEWCVDWYAGDYYGRSPSTDPVNTTKSVDRGLRGGSWSYIPGDCRSAARYRGDPGLRDGDVGFRVACSSR